MHSLLHKWLRKHNVKSPDELDNTPMPDGSPTELETFEDIKRILSARDLTVDSIKEYCQTQLGVIEKKWADYDVSNERKAELIPYHTVYRHLIAVIEAPNEARKALEEQLNKLTK